MVSALVLLVPLVLLVVRSVVEDEKEQARVSAEVAERVRALEQALVWEQVQVQVLKSELAKVQRKE